MEEVVSYVLKSRATQDYRHIEDWPWKRRLTIGITWLLRKRAWSVSKWLVTEAEAIAEERKADLTPSSIIQTDLYGDVIPVQLQTWEFVGMVRRADTEIGPDEWTKIYPGPPPWLEKVWMPHGMRSSGLGFGDMANQFK